MNSFVALIAFATTFNAASADAQAPRLPIRSGQYVFHLKDAEFPNMPGIALTAKISGHHIVLIHKGTSSIYPKGVIAEGELMWHAKSRQWIIGQTNSDRYANEVGGCSAGPDVVDLPKRIYWTC